MGFGKSLSQETASPPSRSVQETLSLSPGGPHAEVRGENKRLQKTEPFIHSPDHHALGTHALTLLEVTGCMLRIQGEISNDPLVRKLTSSLEDVLQTHGWTGEGGEDTEGQGSPLED